MKRGLVFLFFLLFFLEMVYAIGISPPTEYVNFEPGLEKEFSLLILNNAKDNIFVDISAEGDLKDYIFIKDKQIKVGGSAAVNYYLKFPHDLNLTPGNHVGFISFSEGSPRDNSMINVKTAVKEKIIVFVPYPEKYLEATWSIPNIGINETLPIEINLINRGSKSIDLIKGVVEIYSEDIRVKRLFTNTLTNLKPTEKGFLYTEWNTTGQKGGIHEAKVDIYYDEKKLNFSQKFEIGVLSIEIINYTRQIFEESINPFNIIVKSHWNKDIKNIYAEVRIKDKVFKTATQDIEAFKTAELMTYIDTTDMEKGNYDTEIILYYADQKKSKTVQIKIIQKPLRILERINLNTILVIILIIIAIINVIIDIKKRKK